MKKLIPLLLSLVSLCSVAAEREFDVEVIIFKRAVAPDSVNESWPDQLPEIDYSGVGYFSPTYMESKGVTMLPPSELQLTEQRAALDRHAAFTVLFHKAWRQGDQPKSSAPRFRIRAGSDFSSQFNQDGTAKQDSALAPTIGEGEEISIDSPIYQLDGRFQVYVQHYLFLETELDLKAPGQREIMLEQSEVPVTGGTEEGEGTVLLGNLQSVSPTFEVEEFLNSYRLSQTRRMRSGEIHYLDHPLMGIVIQVRRAPEAG